MEWVLWQGALTPLSTYGLHILRISTNCAAIVAQHQCGLDVISKGGHLLFAEHVLQLLLALTSMLLSSICSGEPIDVRLKPCHVVLVGVFHVHGRGACAAVGWSVVTTDRPILTFD